MNADELARLSIINRARRLAMGPYYHHAAKASAFSARKVREAGRSTWARSPEAFPDRVRCARSDKPGHLFGGPHPESWRCPTCRADWTAADELTRRLWGFHGTR